MLVWSLCLKLRLIFELVEYQKKSQQSPFIPKICVYDIKKKISDAIKNLRLLFFEVKFLEE